LIRRLIRAAGYDLVKVNTVKPPDRLPPDFTERDVALFRMVQPYTMTSLECVYALAEAVRYIVTNDIPGSLVECGVWKGGSMMAIARTLLDLETGDRDLYLFDTFAGMPPPAACDVDVYGRSARDRLARADKSRAVWAISPLDDTMKAVHSIGYPGDHIHFIKGRVEEMLPSHAPATIALLRLDLDWHEPTRHALLHLFPRLVSGGIVMVDDYGYWRGARQATDDYFREHKVRILLNRINFTLRMGVKL
jgi:hypothetical protein